MSCVVTTLHIRSNLYLIKHRKGSRTNLSLQVVENVKQNLNERIYKTIIPRNVRLAEAPSHGMPINLYDSRSTGAESYRLLAAEVISRGEEL